MSLSPKKNKRKSPKSKKKKKTPKRGVAWVAQNFDKIPSGGWSTKDRKEFVTIKGEKIEMTPEMREKQVELIVKKKLKEAGVTEDNFEEFVEIKASSNDEDMTIKVKWTDEEIEHGLGVADVGTIVSEAIQEVTKENEQFKKLFDYDTAHPNNMDSQHEVPYDDDWYQDEYWIRFTNANYRYSAKELADLREEFPEMFGLE